MSDRETRRLQAERLESIRHANTRLQQLVGDEVLSPESRLTRAAAWVEDIALALRADEVGLAEIAAYREEDARQLEVWYQEYPAARYPLPAEQDVQHQGLVAEVAGDVTGEAVADRLDQDGAEL